MNMEQVEDEYHGIEKMRTISEAFTMLSRGPDE